MNEHLPQISKREWFAAHAPAEIPEWFADANDGLPPLPQIPGASAALAMVSGSDALSDSDRNEVLQWMRGREWDLPAHIADFGHAAEAVIERARVNHRDAVAEREAARFIAWRWHYADMMVRHSGSAAANPFGQRPFDVELPPTAELRFSRWVGTESMTPWQRSVARLALLLNTTKRGLIDYCAAQHFANELVARLSAPNPDAATRG